jgi:S-adenosylmethionine/arginine decarboxylase-like enzyme
MYKDPQLHTGKHVLVDVRNVSYDLCVNDELMLEVLAESALLVGMKIINRMRYRFCGPDTYPGMTCCLTLDSSHCSCHSYQGNIDGDIDNKNGVAAFDFFSCGDHNPMVMWEFVRNKFGFTDYDIQICDRFK